MAYSHFGTRRGTGSQVALTLTGAAVGLGFAPLLPLPCGLCARPRRPDEARKRLEADKGRLDATQKRSKELQADLDKIAAERQRINARLLETGKLIHQSEAQLS